MRSRQGARRRIATLLGAAVLVGACSPGAREAAPPPDLGPPTTQPGPLASLAATRVELPPPAGSGPVVLVTTVGGVGDPGFDGAVTTLQERPGLIAVPVAASSDATPTTMSGVGVTTHDGAAADAVTHEILTRSASGDPPALVIIGYATTAGPGSPDAHEAEGVAAAAVEHGVSALVVGVERSAQPDYAAASLQLLDVLDFELNRLLDDGAIALRLTVPSCSTGTLRGRIAARASADTGPPARSDCTAPEPFPADDEHAAFLAGYATLAEIER